MNWVPANSVIGPYNRKNYSANINVSGGTRSKKFNQIIRLASITGSKIGPASTFGTVQPIGNDNKYVMKTMQFKPSDQGDNLKIFLNEIRVGSIPTIQAVGPKIYAWTIVRNSRGTAIEGKYIMDSFTRGEPVVAEPADEYLKKFGDACPQEYFTKLREVIHKFWKITKGYHGDFHPGNIAVVTNPNGDIKRVMIFDYGSHKKFKTTTNSTTCFEQFVKIIDKEYANKRKGSNNYYPSNSKIPVVYPKRGQPIRPNTNMLRGMTPNGETIRHNFSSSTMSKISNKNKNNTISRIPTNFKQLNARGKFSHRHAFVSPTAYNKMLGYARPSNRIIARYKTVYPSKTNESLRSALKKVYKSSPINIYYKNKNFPNIDPKSYKTMLNNIGIPIFNPTQPKNRILKVYKTKPKHVVLQHIKRDMFPNMTNNNYKKMLKNYHPNLVFNSNSNSSP